MRKITNFLFLNKNTRQTIIKNTFWLSFGEIISRLLKVVLIFYIIRLLGASSWGVFSYAISLCTLFMIFSDLGLSSILTREVSKKEFNIHEIIATTSLLKISINFISFLAIIFLAPYFATENLSNSVIFLVAIILLFDSLRDFIFAINRGAEKMESEVFIKIFTNLILITLTYFFIQNKPNVDSLAYGYAIGSFVSFVFVFLFFKKYFKNIKKYFKPSIVKPILTAAWPFAFFSILGAIMMNTDTLMIGLLRNELEVGYYATSHRIIFFLYMIPTLITTSLLPSLSKKTIDLEEIKNITNSSLKTILFLIIPIIAGVLLLGTEIITTVLGDEYKNTGLILKISIISTLFIFPALIINNIIFIFNKHKNLIKITLLGTILNVVINILLIPLYGGAGAAIATLVTQSCMLLLIKKQLDNIIKIKIFSNIHKIVISTLLMSGLVYIFKLHNINIYISVFTSAIFYILVLYVLKEDLFLKIKRNLNI